MPTYVHTYTKGHNNMNAKNRYNNTDTRFTLTYANRPCDDAPCVQIAFIDKPHKSVKDALKSFATESGARMFAWDGWNGVWYATEKALGGNLPNVCKALTNALNDAPAKREARASATAALQAEMSELRVLIAQLVAANAK